MSIMINFPWEFTVNLQLFAFQTDYSIAIVSFLDDYRNVIGIVDVYKKRGCVEKLHHAGGRPRTENSA